MEKIDFEYNDTFRNKLIDLLRIVAIISFILIIIINAPIKNKIISILLSVPVVLSLLWPNKLRITGYYDAIRFRTKNLHWIHNKDFAVLFNKIKRVEIPKVEYLNILKIIPGMTEIYPARLILHLNNGKTVKKLMFLKESETLKLKEILDSKTTELNNNASS